MPLSTNFQSYLGGHSYWWRKTEREKTTNLSQVPDKVYHQNVLKFYQQLTGEERRMPFIFDDFHFCRSRVIGLDMTENKIFTLCRMIT
jgi:hypothetical protein